MGDQRRPDSPPDRVLRVAREVPQLARLLEFLEKHLDFPARAVDFRGGPGAPREVVGQERQGAHVSARQMV
ncbi:MAG: hypothetical protein IK066_05710, partial [Kiritimatiellae bacterium]|nr:hypothetical protein [Kiritimatiellia bacterium]